MYINPEKYAVMAQTLRFGNVQQYFLSKRSILKGGHCYPYMSNNIDEAMRIREFLNARYDGDYHIKVFTVEG